MKTTKLAFSVYALTLVLMTSGAMAAGGSANPSCTANTFTLLYTPNLDACGGYVPNGGIDFTDEQVTETWGEQLFLKTPEQIDWGNSCIGYELYGWTSTAANSSLDLDEQHTNDQNTWKTVPLANGSTIWALESNWTPTISKITLNTNGGGSVIPSEIYK